MPRNDTNNLGVAFGINGRSGLALTAAAGILLAVNFVLVLVFLLPRFGQLDFLRLHYTAELGVDWVAEWWKIFIFPGLGVMVFFSNALFSGILAKKHRLYGHLIWTATLAIEAMLAAASFLVIRING
ncbi:MAG: hypothetical protein WCT10_02730 [Patescibacteria group bacterium]|jgi:hypothetical protein